VSETKPSFLRDFCIWVINDYSWRICCSCLTFTFSHTLAARWLRESMSHLAGVHGFVVHTCQKSPLLGNSVHVWCLHCIGIASIFAAVYCGSSFILPISFILLLLHPLFHSLCWIGVHSSFSQISHLISSLG